MKQLCKNIFIFIFLFLIVSSNAENSNNDDRDKTKVNIVGGTDARIGEFPHIVTLLDKNMEFYCGGSLIYNDIILTAAHCCIG